MSETLRFIASEDKQIVETRLRGLKLGNCDGEPLHALVAEIDLHAHIHPLAFRVDDYAGAELSRRSRRWRLF